MKHTLLWPTLLAIAGMAVLLGLGTWQVRRLSWKEGLIARIEARAHGEPVSLDEALRRWRATGDVEYLRVRFSGRFLHDRERHYYDVVAGKPGWRVITPIRTATGVVVLVDRGYVPEALKEPKARAAGQVTGEIGVTGLARAPARRGLFVPENDRAKNQWFWRDLVGMAAGIVEARDGARLVPFFVESEGASVPGGWPKGGVTRLDLPNRHLQYAITWYGLAAALAAVYSAFVWSQLKRTRFT